MMNDLLIRIKQNGKYIVGLYFPSKGTTLSALSIVSFLYRNIRELTNGKRTKEIQIECLREFYYSYVFPSIVDDSSEKGYIMQHYISSSDPPRGWFKTLVNNNWTRPDICMALSVPVIRDMDKTKRPRGSSLYNVTIDVEDNMVYFDVINYYHKIAAFKTIEKSKCVKHINYNFHQFRLGDTPAVYAMCYGQQIVVNDNFVYHII